MERPNRIAKATVTKKNSENGLRERTVLSLEDELVLSPSYAAIQDVGSGIRLVLSEAVDNETGNLKDVVTTAIIPTWVFDQIKTVCQQSICQPAYPNTGDIAAAIQSQKKLYTAIETMLNNLTRGLYEVCTQGDNLAAAVDTSVQAALASIATVEGEGQTSKFLTAGDAMQYNYKITQKMPTSSNLTLFAQAKIQRLASGEQNRPWTITIRNFQAVSHGSGYLTDSVEQDYINTMPLSDTEMYRLAYAVEHFVAQWERSTLNTFIQSRSSHKK